MVNRRFTAGLIATGALVNVAEQRLKDTQSQGDDSPATPLRLTSSEAASHDKYENENCLADGNYKLYTLNTKQENINAMTHD